MSRHKSRPSGGFGLGVWKDWVLVARWEGLVLLVRSAGLGLLARLEEMSVLG